MFYIHAKEQGDVYVDIRTGCRLPHDSYLNDKDKLKSLSGPVISKRLEDLEEGAVTE